MEPSALQHEVAWAPTLRRLRLEVEFVVVVDWRSRRGTQEGHVGSARPWMSSLPGGGGIWE